VQMGHESTLTLSSDEHDDGPLQTCDTDDSDRDRRFLLDTGPSEPFERRMFLSSEMEPETEPVPLPEPLPESDRFPALLLAARFTFFDLLFDALEFRSDFFGLSTYFDFDSRLARLLLLDGRTFRYFRTCFRWVELSR
jgi:hypothetical protein